MNNRIFITSLVVNKQKKKCSITLNDGEVFHCDIDLIFKHRLTKDKIITPVELELIRKEQVLYELKQKALNFASFKPRTEQQVRNKLSKLGYKSEECDYAILFLKKFDYLNDERYATAITNDWLKRRPSSASHMIGDLCKRGINKDIAQKVVNSLFPNVDVVGLAEQSSEKKMRAIKNLPLDRQKLRLFNHLQRMGFTWDVINQMMKKYFNSIN